jgi:hypothetical protein
MNAFRYTGQAAEVRWGYFIAAALGAFTLTANGTGTRVTAEVRDVDPIKSVQPGLRFCVVRQSTVWTWPIESLQIADGTLTASLGPQE